MITQDKRRPALIKTTLNIEGMMCTMCEAHINEAVRKHFKVNKVKSSHKKGVTEILSQAPLAEDELKEAIDETGYILKDIKSEQTENKGLFSKLFG